jgi:putative methionine-R-sulfoxide reductase with GAF domain/HAMP domain-containing protein
MLRLSIRKKILVGFVALIVFFIGNVVFIFYTISNSQYIVTSLFEDKDQAVILLNDFKDIVTRSKMYTMNWVFQRKDEEGKALLKQILNEDYPLLKSRFEKYNTIWSNQKQTNQISKILLEFDFLRESEEEITRKLAKFTDYDDFVIKSEADDILEATVIPQADKILLKIDSILLQKKSEKQEAQQEILASFGNLVWVLIVSIVVFVVLGILMSFFVANKISKPIIELKAIIDALGRGEQPKAVEVISNDEIGDMEVSVNQLIKGLSDTSDFAENIGRSNFDAAYTPLSRKDILGNSLLEMRDNLKKASEEDKKRFRINEGSAIFSDILRKYSDSINDLATQLLATLVNFIGANQGNFFIINDDHSEDTHLELVAAYAWNKRKFVKKRVEIGEGTVGQAWIEKDTLLITDVPNDYIKITSGMGGSNPRCIVVVPFIFNEQVFGVVELASFKVFESYEVEFLRRLAENIGSTISAIKINERTKRLLNESQTMSEQLRSQEEEMRQQMEELMATQDELKRKIADYERINQIS